MIGSSGKSSVCGKAHDEKLKMKWEIREEVTGKKLWPQNGSAPSAQFA